MLKDVLQIRCPLVSCYALRQGDALYLIDTGFLGAVKAIEQALDQDGWRELSLKGIILTHGHLDHTFNAAKLAAKHGAWVMAPEADRVLLEGDFHATGLGWVGGQMQQIAASLFGYQHPADVRWYDGDTSFDFLNNFKLLPLPGHSAGHSGFVWGRHLFCGDLFASFALFSHWPPGIFNLDNEQVKKNLLRVAKMDLEGVFPHHCDKVSAAKHLERLHRLALRFA